MNDEMMDYAEAARMTGVKIGTLYSMVSKRQIPHVRITPRLVRFSRVALERWLAERSVAPVVEKGPADEVASPEASRPIAIRGAIPRAPHKGMKFGVRKLGHRR